MLGAEGGHLQGGPRYVHVPGARRKGRLSTLPHPLSAPADGVRPLTAVAGDGVGGAGNCLGGQPIARRPAAAVEGEDALRAAVGPVLAEETADEHRPSRSEVQHSAVDGRQADGGVAPVGIGAPHCRGGGALTRTADGQRPQRQRPSRGVETIKRRLTVHRRGRGVGHVQAAQQGEHHQPPHEGRGEERERQKRRGEGSERSEAAERHLCRREGAISAGQESRATRTEKGPQRLNAVTEAGDDR